MAPSQAVHPFECTTPCVLIAGFGRGCTRGGPYFLEVYPSNLADSVHSLGEGKPQQYWLWMPILVTIVSIYALAVE